MSARGARPIAVLLTICAIGCIPPLAGRVFALEPLHSEDRLGLWLLSTCVLAFAWLVVARTARTWILRVGLVTVSLVSIELGARLFVRWFTVWPRERLAQLSHIAYPDLIKFQAHPFLQFTGRPRTTLRGNEALSGTTPFNQSGFFGDDLPRDKPAGTVRVACLGASTTASGYPARMQAYLNETTTDGAAFECMNFAHGFYNTNHSVVNFCLNALDYDPDYVVIHHGWNDARASVNARAFRGDYTHALRAFAPPECRDWLLIRTSIVYRFARYRWLGAEASEYLDAAVIRPTDPDLGHDPSLTRRTFERNLNTILDAALARGIVPVLATLPRSTDPNIRFAAAADEMDGFADVMRKVASERGADVELVDLARRWTDKNEWFKDVGHMVPEGIAAKAHAIGDAILARRR